MMLLTPRERRSIGIISPPTEFMPSTATVKLHLDIASVSTSAKAFTISIASFIKESYNGDSNTIVVGRDARISGKMVENLVVGTLMSMGFDVINIGKASTPTTELAVVGEKACGGIIITASHNPVQWNALKLLNHNGEFLSDAEGKEVIRRAENDAYSFAEVFSLGNTYNNETWANRHIEMVKALALVDTDAISKCNFTVAARH